MITLFLIYYFNIDMRIMAFAYNFLQKRFDKKQKETTF